MKIFFTQSNKKQQFVKRPKGYTLEG